MEECDGFCVRFKEKQSVTIQNKNGKKVSVHMSPHEYIDIDILSGKFFVKNKFTGSKMKMIDPSTDVHQMDMKLVRGFIESVKSNDKAVVWGIDR